MKKWKKLITAVLVIALMALTGLAVWQKDNLKALYVLLTNDSQSISQNMEEKQQAQQEKLEELRTLPRQVLQERLAPIRAKKVRNRKVNEEVK